MKTLGKLAPKLSTKPLCIAVAKLNLSWAQFALAFCNSRRFVASTIIGATSVPQLRENAAAFSVKWTEEMENDVSRVFRIYKDPAKN